MKKSKAVLGIILSVLILSTSCSDFLKENEMDSIPVDYIYSSAEGLESGLVGLYNLRRDCKWGDVKAGLFLYGASDLALIRTYNDDMIYGTSMTPLLFGNSPWIEDYKVIDRANALIEKTPKATMSDDEKNVLLAQAKYIRAHTYFDLLRLYDNIILDTIATTGDNAFAKRNYVPADPKDVYRLINSDLDYAISHLSWEVDPGRAGQGAARMVKAKVAMWQKKWAIAAYQCDTIIKSGYYSLVDISRVFGQDVNGSKETIKADQYDQVNGGSSSLAGGHGVALPAFFENRYYEISSEILSADSLGGHTDGWIYPNKYLKSLYDTAHDKRFKYYYWSMTYYVNNPASPNFGKPLATNLYPDNYRRYHWSLKKYFDIDKPVTTESWKDVIVYRLAETYLLGAEAHWRMSGNNTDSKALEYIGKIRERAGLPNISSVNQQAILDERARELAFEGKRWYTLKRMGVLIDQVNKHLMYGSSSQNVVHRRMKAYMVRLPIPQSQIDLMNGQFPQNEGY